MNACACMIDFEAKFNLGIVSILADIMSQQFRHTENIVNEQIAKKNWIEVIQCTKSLQFVHLQYFQ